MIYPYVAPTYKSVVYVRLERNYVKNDIFLLPTHPQWRLRSEYFFWLCSYVRDDTRATRSNKTAAAAASTNLNFRASDLPKPSILHPVLLVQSSDTYIVQSSGRKTHRIVWAKSSQPFITKKVKAGNFRLS